MLDRHRSPGGDELQELRVEIVRRERRDPQLTEHYAGELERDDVRRDRVVLRPGAEDPVVLRRVHGDRARIDAEDLADARHERPKQNVELEVSERGVGDRL